MNDLTAGEAWRIQEDLETQAASLLGRLLFAFSRLDTNVGLLVASIERVLGREGFAASVAQLTFHKRLDRFATFLSEEASLSTTARDAYTEWIAAAHRARIQRNEFVHGRWSADPHKGAVLNVIGLPSGEQRTVSYTPAELQGAVSQIEELQAQLWQLRKRWPI
jgi:hypothetical protein